jgi:hypothetical protein
VLQIILTPVVKPLDKKERSGRPSHHRLAVPVRWRQVILYETAGRFRALIVAAAMQDVD